MARPGNLDGGGAILALNCGSSSIKYAVFEAVQAPPVLKGQIAGIDAAPRLDGAALGGEPEGRSHEELLDWLMDRLRAVPEGAAIAAIGHRVVHGGMAHDRSVVLTPDVIADLEALVPLAPRHQPHNLAGIRAAGAHWPDLPQVACFDTAFHRSQPWQAQSFALPRAMTAEGIRRYGFHGLSYDYIRGAMGPHLREADRRVVVGHLGHGSSLCAMLDGRSVATTMGFTALDGLMMATRSGAIDPGVILYLLDEKGMSREEVATLLYTRSGLLGVSGISGDMRLLLASEDGPAREAIALYCYRIARETGSLMAALEGLDAMVFTGGVGENAAAIRAAVCRRLAWTGLEIDDVANERGDSLISTPRSRVRGLVIRTDEEAVIARDTAILTARS